MAPSTQRSYEHLLHLVRTESLVDPTALEALQHEARRRGDWRGEVVALVQGEPEPWHWKALCDLVECMNERELAGWLPWLQEALDARWPDRLRVLPEPWLHHALERGDGRLVSLARTARLSSLGSELERVCTEPMFGGLRRLAVGREAPRWFPRASARIGAMLGAAEHLRGLERLALPFVPGHLVEALHGFAVLTHLRAPLAGVELSALGAHPTLRALDLRGIGNGGALVGTLVETPLWRRLERLGLRGLELDDAAIEMLAEWRNRLVYLDVSRCNLQPWGIHWLLRSPTLRGLKTVRAARHGPWGFEDPRLDPADVVPEWLDEP